MLQSFFTALYQALLGNPDPSSLIPVYRQSIFPGVGLTTFFVALAMALLFYVVLNRVVTTSFFKTQHWAIMLLLTAVLGAIVAWQQAAAAVEAQLAETGEELAVAQVSTLKRYLWGFTATNTLVAVLFFILCSFAVKSLSVSARTTPVRWPN
ncbi:hypothetical protein [Hymenobacter volaticus]|uniref:Uncharacterized protein n=1 Tax=Hymenobacter volaticus TaxID=2932254 RepID=A0ABY4G3V8_9BACT|nr:hypothetical protein [Hymenobacter volaticus]UOQ65577.1 hypothetical protein MUN86_18850 [Hymenobacter volaticus]